jgi:hypothetical protein
MPLVVLVKDGSRSKKWQYQVVLSWLQRLPQDNCKQTLDHWKDSAAEYVQAELFDKKQFVIV